jgi:hypothetical protein
MMANWCSNTVTFTGEQSRLDELETLFTQMADKEKKEEKGQLPPFIEEDGNWLFEIEWEVGTLFYETRWSPNIGVIRQVADHYHVDFTHDYCETGNGVYGQAIYENGELQDICLDSSDFDQYDYDGESDSYLFEGEDYDNDDEILEILLERKKKQIEP